MGPCLELKWAPRLLEKGGGGVKGIIFDGSEVVEDD